MKIIILLLLLIINNINIIKCSFYNTLEISEININYNTTRSCNKIINIDQCIDICNNGYLKIISSQDDSINYQFNKDSCNNFNTTFTSKCGSTLYLDQNNIYSTKCLNINKSPPISSTHSTRSPPTSNFIDISSNDYYELINIPIFISAIPLLILLF